MTSAALLLAAALACPQPGTNDLSGLWESSTTSKGGIGQTLEFRADGTFVEAVTVLVDLHYRLDGDRLFVTDPAAGNDDPRNATVVRFTGRKMIAKGPDGSTVEKERLGEGGPGAPTVVGAWRYRHYTGAIAFERYTADGRIFFRLPMVSSTGCYVVRGATLLLAKPGGTERSVQHAEHGNELTLTGPSGETSTYRQDEAGAWYDREHIDYKPRR